MSVNASYNEKELVIRLAKGDENAFSILFNRYRNKVYHTALKFSLSTIIAEEIVQDVFLKIWIKRTDIIYVQNFQAYLFVIAQNDIYRALNLIAQNHKKISFLDVKQLAFNNDTENRVLDKEYHLLLQKGIAQLPTQQKRIYTLIKEQGLKRDEVATLLQVDPETVKTHLAQAMKKLRVYCLMHLRYLLIFIVNIFSRLWEL